MTAFGNSLIILAAVLLFIGGVILLGLGGWVYARATADVFRSRAHRVSAEAQEDTIDAARDALDDIQDRRHRETYQDPTDEELRAFARAGVENDRIVSSMSTDQGEVEDGIPGDKMWIGEAESA